MAVSQEPINIFTNRFFILSSMGPTSAGHNFRCPLISPLSVDPLFNGTVLIFHSENVNLMEERLFLSLFKASALKIRFCRIC
jgi:hypothetical protein